MKKRFNILTILILIFTLFVFNNISVQADTPLINMIDGASIRTTGTQGLKFQATYDESLLNEERGFFIIYGESSISELEEILNNNKPLIINGKDIKIANSFDNLTPTISVVLTGIPVGGYNQSITVIGYSLVDDDYIFVPTVVTRSVAQVALNAANAGDSEVVKDVLADLDSSFYNYRFNSDGNLEFLSGIYDEEGNYISYLDYNIVKTGSKIVLPTLDKLGYDFDGYLYSEDLLLPGSNYEVKESAVLYPQFSLIQYTIKYYDGEIELVELNNEYNIESGIELKNYIKEGYIFEGWYDNAEFSGYPITEFPIDTVGDLELYAKTRVSEETAKFEFLEIFEKDLEDIDAAEVVLAGENITVTFLEHVSIEAVEAAANALIESLRRYAGAASTLRLDDKEFYLSEVTAIDIALAILNSTSPDDFLEDGESIKLAYEALVYYKGIDFTLNGELEFKVEPTKEGFMARLRSDLEDIDAAKVVLAGENITVTFKDDIEIETVYNAAADLVDALGAYAGPNSILIVAGTEFSLGNIDLVELALAILSNVDPEEFLMKGESIQVDYVANIQYRNITITLNGKLIFNVELKKFYLNYEALDNGSILGQTNQIVLRNSSSTAVEAVPNYGYHFVQWSDGSTANPRIDSSVNSDINVYAVFALNTYVVAFVDYDGTILKEQIVTHGFDAIPPQEPQRVGYTFDKWDKAYLNIEDHVTITASYNINKYKVTYIANGEIFDEEIYEYQSNINPKGTPFKIGYNFSEWINLPEIMPAKDIIIYAAFEIKDFSLYIIGYDGPVTYPEAVELEASVISELEVFITYEWYKDNVLISDSNILIVNDVIKSGSYKLTATLNHEGNIVTKEQEIDVQIKKATYNMTGISFNNNSFTYDGTEKSLFIEGELPEGVTVSYDQNGRINVGTLIVTASFEGDYDRYEMIPNLTAALEITPANATIIIDNKTIIYGDEDVQLTAIVDGAYGEDELDYSLFRVSGNNVGTYSIKALIEENPNYNISVIEGLYYINKKPVSITVNEASKEFGSIDPIFTFIHSSLVGIDKFSGNPSRMTGEVVGTYEFTVGTLNLTNNYEIQFENEFKINPKPVTVIIDDKESEYLDNTSELTYQPINGEVSQYPLEIILTKIDGDDVGEYQINGTLTSNPNNDNYIVNFIPGKYTIIPTDINNIVIISKGSIEENYVDNSIKSWPFDNKIVNNLTLTVNGKVIPTDGFNFKYYELGNPNIEITSLDLNDGAGLFVVRPMIYDYSNPNFNGSFTEFNEDSEVIIKLKSVTVGNNTNYMTIEDALLTSGTTTIIVKYYSKFGSSESVEKVYGTSTFNLVANRKLLVPMNNSFSESFNTAGAYPSYSARKDEFSRLTIEKGITLNVSGTVIINAERATQSTYYTGLITGSTYGVLKISKDALVNVKSGGNYLAYGFSTGEGLLDIKSGGKLEEFVSIYDYKGGTATSNNRSNAMVFNFFAPMSVSNRTKFVNGSKYFGKAFVTASSNRYFSDINLLDSSNALMSLQSGALYKYLDDFGKVVFETDNANIEFKGQLKLKIRVVFINMEVSFADKDIPISGFYKFDIKNNSIITLDSHIMMFAGSEVSVDGTSTININKKLLLAGSNGTDPDYGEYGKVYLDLVANSTTLGHIKNTIYNNNSVTYSRSAPALFYVEPTTVINVGTNGKIGGTLTEGVMYNFNGLSPEKVVVTMRRITGASTTIDDTYTLKNFDGTPYLHYE